MTDTPPGLPADLLDQLIDTFGDRITWDADGRTYTVHPAAPAEEEQR